MSGSYAEIAKAYVTLIPKIDTSGLTSSLSKATKNAVNKSGAIMGSTLTDSITGAVAGQKGLKNITNAFGAAGRAGGESISNAITDSLNGSSMASAGATGGEAIGGGILSSIKGIAIGGALANLITSAGSHVKEAVQSVFSDAFNGFSDYEQLVGGMDTLFKEASGKIQEMAANAFLTSGMSMNEYMDLSTSFAASLISSLEGDVEKAADLSDMAVQDISDNCNKMGTDLQSLQFAYQGFAKQNYTINLMSAA